MDPSNDPSAEMAAVLRRYLAIQREEQLLLDEKKQLQEAIGRHMAARKSPYWYPELDGQRLKVRFAETSVIEYDEPLLRDRLGSRFAAILAPDLRKIRRQLPQLESALTPVLDLVGSPSPEKVRAAVEQGLIAKEEFAGAFKKSVRRLVAVMKAGREEGPKDAGENAESTPGNLP
jgi:hypothetical protein